MDESCSFTTADLYKTQIHTKLLELVPERLGRLDQAVLKDKPIGEALAPIYIYMQGVAEALDAFDIDELLLTVEGAPATEFDA